MLTYDRQTVDAANPLARYAHRARIAVGVDMVRRRCRLGATVLDFGAGPGLFLHRLGQRRPDVRLVALDPYVVPEYGEIQVVGRLADVPSRSVDVLTAFEVCEHLHDHELEELIAEASRVLYDDGVIVLSVPIMLGFAIVPKILNWMVRERTWHVEYSAREVWRSLWGRPVERPADPRHTHKGFDFRQLRDRFAASFDIDDARYSPLRFLPWWLSSQFFLVCRVKSE